MSSFFTTTSTCFSANWLTLFCVMCNTVSTKIRESMAKNIQVFQSLRHSSLKEWSGEWRARVRLQFNKWLQSRRSWPLREVQSWIREKRDLNPKNKSSFAANLRSRMKESQHQELVFLISVGYIFCSGMKQRDHFSKNFFWIVNLKLPLLLKISIR